MMNIVRFRDERCKSCGLCIKACPKGIIEINQENLNDKGYRPAHIVDQDACTGCASCALMCPDGVISVYREEEQ